MLDRVNGDVVPFGSTAQGTERTVFGAVTQSDAIDDNVNTSYIRGWGIVGVNDAPTKQDFNAMVFTSSYLTAYLYQQGIATYNLLQKYYINSRCTGSDGNIYRALTGTSAVPNVGNNPVGDFVNWKADFGDINTLTAKTTPVDADELVIADSADAFSLKKLNFTALKTYFDTFYSLSSSIFAINQTWQNMTSLRNSGVTYTNTTGKPIEVLYTNSGAGSFSLSIGAANMGLIGGGATRSSISFVVPNGVTYRITGTVQQWNELR